ncbi:hypothetical protein PAJL_513 [Cutibacterium acnes HL042PA3]|nr:hypothetical protein PAJL_513 [Cutibacterium acnes HL042PA3]
MVIAATVSKLVRLETGSSREAVLARWAMGLHSRDLMANFRPADSPPIRHTGHCNGGFWQATMGANKGKHHHDNEDGHA